MKKWIKILLIIGLIILIIGIIGGFIVNKNQKNNNKITEIEPEEEISEEQERQTLVSLYFKNISTGEIEPEARLIDVKKLVQEPYNTLMALLLEEPKNSKLTGVIPSNTIINSIKLEGDSLILDFSQEFVDNAEKGKESEEKIIESLVNTMTELTEVNSIKILINGEKNKAFLDNEVTFDKEFVRKDI